MTKLSVLRSGVILDNAFKNIVYSLLKRESPYKEIIAKLNEAKFEVEKNGENRKIKRNVGCTSERSRARFGLMENIILPEDVLTKSFVLTELHAVPC